MRLLLLGQEIRDLRQVRNFSGVYSFFLARALRAAGVDVVFADPSKEGLAYRRLELVGADHIVGMHSRHFDLSPPDCMHALRARFRGKITQLSDRPLKRQSVDCTFTARDAGGMAGNHSIGWAADPELCRPAQQPGELMILIDHPDYVERGKDRTANVMRQVRHLVDNRPLWSDRFDSVAVFEVADGAMERSDLVPRTYSRRHIPYAEACFVYSHASLFMVTHKESLGLTVLETAMCGALPVVPQGFVPPDRLCTVRHVEYTGEIDWLGVLDMIDVEASRQAALANSWTAVAGRMLDWFGQFG